MTTIGIMGTHCSGKTTLATAVANKMRLPLIVGTARKIPEERLTCIGGQIDAMLAQIRAELPHWGFVSDRTVIDNYAYYSYWAEKTTTTDGLDWNILKMAEGYVKNHHYDVIFFVNETLPLEDDGFRDTDPAYQTWILEFMRKYMSDFTKIWGADIVPVAGTTDERMEIISKKLHWGE